MTQPARARRFIRNYGRLFARPHIKTTLITLATIYAIFTGPSVIQRASAMEGLAAGFLFGLFILWGRQVWITDDYDKAEAAAAEAERVRQQAQRDREARKIPPPAAAFSYDILGLSENATDAEIIQNYHSNYSNK